MGIRPGRERGQFLVLFALTVTGLLLVVGLLYSFGLILAERRSLQTAADAASLAGSWVMLSELQNDNRRSSLVNDSVAKYAQTNGFTGVYLDASGNSVGVLSSSGTFLTTARGVRVTLTNSVGLVLPGLVPGLPGRLQESASATAALRQSAPPQTATLVVPVAVALDDFKAVYGPHTQYDLFSPTHPPASQPPTLDFLAGATTPATGACCAAPLADNLQHWSDGQHANGTLTPGGVVALAGGAYFDSISTGLLDNVSRQAPTELPSPAYALILVPVWDNQASQTAGTVRIVGFAQMKLLGSDINSTRARGVFVPFPVSAGVTTATTSGDDLGAALVQLTS